MNPRESSSWSRVNREPQLARRAPRGVRLLARFGGAAGFGAALLASISCESPRQSSELERGQRAFARHCASCHGPDGAGRPMPGLSTPPTNLAAPAFQSSRSDADLREVLMNGKGAMPPLGRLLSENEVTELIRFVRTLPPRR